MIPRCHGLTKMADAVRKAFPRRRCRHLGKTIEIKFNSCHSSKIQQLALTNQGHGFQWRYVIIMELSISRRGGVGRARGN